MPSQYRYPVFWKIMYNNDNKSRPFERANPFPVAPVVVCAMPWLKDNRRFLDTKYIGTTMPTPHDKCRSSSKGRPLRELKKE